MPAKAKSDGAVAKKGSKEPRDEKAIAANKRKLPLFQKNKVIQSKKQIAFIKRQGGTIRFAKKVRLVRKKLDKQRALQRKIVSSKIVKAKKEAAKKAVEGKKTKDGKAVKPVFRPEHRYKIKKMRHFYKTQLAPRTLPSKNFFSDMNVSTRPKIAKLRKSLQPGTVCILVAGKYKGSRVVMLKQLQRSGLCLVTGPFKINHVPLRRVCQNYLIATSVRVDLEGVKVPKKINDSYFKKEKAPKKKSGEEDIFEVKKKKKKGPSDTRKEDQKVVDRQIVHAIKKGKDTQMVLRYLKCKFSVMGKRYPHDIKF